ncbi:hypothetical protein, partial [Acinetobacter genomosp. 33YU]
MNLKNTTYGQYFEREQIDTDRLKVIDFLHKS